MGYLVHQRGIEANPEKIRAITEMKPPKTISQVQSLVGNIVALNRFISKSADRSLPFFQTLRKAKNFVWTEECDQAFDRLKEYMTTSPLLAKSTEGEPLYIYISISDVAISSVLVKIEGVEHKPVYYLSKLLQGAEKNYLEIEKFALALVVAARKLRPYFLTYKLVVLTNQPLRQVLAKPEASGRLIKWAVGPKWSDEV